MTSPAAVQKGVDADRLCQPLGGDARVRVLDACLAEP